MAVVDEKLYPPYIEGVIPAFYFIDSSNLGAAIIAVPFSLNKAVDIHDIGDIQIKVKTVQQNQYVFTGYCENISEALSTYIAKFRWENPLNSINIGDYVKIQIAFVKQVNGVLDSIGYFSTVGVSKLTVKPKVYIEGLENDNVFKIDYIGVHNQEVDLTENEYSYCFNLYNNKNELIETSDWQLHDSTISLDVDVSPIYNSVDQYSFYTALTPNVYYYIEYGVRTVNGVEVWSKKYSCMDIEALDPDLKANLNASNNFSEGYISLTLTPTTNINFTKGSYVIKRASEKDNFQTWAVLTRKIFKQLDILTKWEYRDYIVEQGVTYQYSIQQFNEQGLQSSRIYSNQVYCDFEDIFLYDGKKQLKIRYNPKITSFKIDRLEQKVDTIGSKYPFFYRNGATEYHEFPISGLLSYLADNEFNFMTSEELGLDIDNYTRLETPSNPLSNTHFPTTQLEDYNMKAERLFKNAVLEWLGNGIPKIFKSAAEGNFIVRIMNPSLAPEDKLGRLIHTVSCTAYEVNNYNYRTLMEMGFINSPLDISYVYGYETVPFYNLEYGYPNTGKLNNNPIEGFFMIEGAMPGTEIYIDGQKTIIGNNGMLRVDLDGTIINSIVLPADTFTYGQLTYKYKMVDKATNNFAYINKITLTEKGQSFMGPADISGYFTNNLKKEILTYLFLNFEQKKITKLYYNKEEYNDVRYSRHFYYDDNFLHSIDLSELDYNTVYEIYSVSINENNIYKKDYTLETYIINSNFEDNLDLTVRVNNTTFSGKPRISFSVGYYSDIMIGNGMICHCFYQQKNISYTIESTDFDLKNLQSSLSNWEDSVVYLQLLEQKLTALQEEEEAG